MRPKTSWTRQLDRRQPHNYFTPREESVCLLPHKTTFSSNSQGVPLEEFIQTVYILLVARPRGSSFMNWQRFGPQEGSWNSFEDWVRKQEIAPSKKIRIPESKKALLVESGIPLTFEIRNPDSTDKESRIHIVESRIQDCIGYPYMRRSPGVLLGILRGVCRPVVQILTLFQTQKCHYSHPF